MLRQWQRCGSAVREDASARNRIERRYAWADAQGVVRERADTCEVIRPYAPEALRALLAQRGFEVTDVWWDYGTRARPEGAQFVTMRARR